MSVSVDFAVFLSSAPIFEISGPEREQHLSPQVLSSWSFSTIFLQADNRRHEFQWLFLKALRFALVRILRRQFFSPRLTKHSLWIRQHLASNCFVLFLQINYALDSRFFQAHIVYNRLTQRYTNECESHQSRNATLTICFFLQWEATEVITLIVPCLLAECCWLMQTARSLSQETIQQYRLQCLPKDVTICSTNYCLHWLFHQLWVPPAVTVPTRLTLSRWLPQWMPSPVVQSLMKWVDRSAVPWCFVRPYDITHKFSFVWNAVTATGWIQGALIVCYLQFCRTTICSRNDIDWFSCLTYPNATRFSLSNDIHFMFNDESRNWYVNCV